MGIGFIAYQFALEETVARHHGFYLAKARMLAAEAATHGDASDAELLGTINAIWNSSDTRPADEYICIVDRDARLLLHSAHPETVGRDAGINRVGEPGKGEACTLRDLVRLREDFVGDYVSGAGQHQVAAFATAPKRNWTIGVHRSKAAVMREVRSGIGWLAIGFLVVCGLLMPASLAMLARTFQAFQRKRLMLEAEREKLIVRLEAQNAELERFTYTVSHDLKSPLITLKCYMGVMQEDLANEDAEAVDVDVKRMSDAADEMVRLLDDLLELSRIGRLVNPPEEVSLEELIHETLALVDGRITPQGIRVDIGRNLPPLFGDRRRLVEVLQNLIDNAAKYMGDQAEPRIEIGAYAHGGETVCYVRDNGIGIDTRYHAKVFELFDQLDPTFEGSGVGLALVKRIVEIHGGRIWIESDGPGTGSCFFFALPSKNRLDVSGVKASAKS
ncbi:MAG TPA: HAMP domain-containing sensor histidine kinase [Thermoguttaceae bacterium]|nr:HAMP domain-containing sensor histidine kinase [Thermoguttaceae bacterium]